MTKSTSKDQSHRCKWAGSDPIYQHYHDTEWAVPVYDDRKLFEFLILEGAQAGLSWITILKRRQGYIEAFDNFEVQRVAKFDDKKIELLLTNPRIIRNRLKVRSAVTNANAFIKIQDEFGSFYDYQWQFVDGQPQQNSFNEMNQVPVKTQCSDIFSHDLKQRGFSFVGSTIMYAHMQAVGMVNDHTTDCFRYQEIRSLACSSS